MKQKHQRARALGFRAAGASLPLSTAVLPGGMKLLLPSAPAAEPCSLQREFGGKDGGAGPAAGHR